MLLLELWRNGLVIAVHTDLAPTVSLGNQRSIFFLSRCFKSSGEKDIFNTVHHNIFSQIHILRMALFFFLSSNFMPLGRCELRIFNNTEAHLWWVSLSMWRALDGISDSTELLFHTPHKLCQWATQFFPTLYSFWDKLSQKTLDPDNYIYRQMQLESREWFHIGVTFPQAEERKWYFMQMRQGTNVD